MFIFIGYYISHYDINLYGRITIYVLGFLGLLTFIFENIIKVIKIMINHLERSDLNATY